MAWLLKYRAALSSCIPRSLRDALKDEAGTYTVEMAFVMPLYLMLIFGFTSAALLLFVYCETTYACRAAVRFASVHSSSIPCNASNNNPCAPADIQKVLTDAMPTINGGQFTPSGPTYGAKGNMAGSTVSVGVQILYSAGLPYMQSSPITLSSSAQAYILH